jgi:hypothetical protein
MQRERLPALIAVIATCLLIIGVSALVNRPKNSPDPSKKTGETTIRLLDDQGNSIGTNGGGWIKPICPKPVLIGKAASSPSKPLTEQLEKKGVPILPIPAVRMEFYLTAPSVQPPGEQPNAEVWVQLSPSATKLLNEYWEVFCDYYFKIEKVKEREAKKDLMRGLMNARGNFAYQLQKAHVDAPDGKRCICEDEAWDVINLLTLSAQEAMGQYLKDKSTVKPAI